ncbi:MAG: hypothetical protein KAR54_02095 [Candidatus Pacebacteria bacterium]|nr:hypothetical protein [Candidatus Paceibacterota bacterium]
MERKKISKKTPFLPIKSEWGLICSQASIDQELNNISLFNIISQINLPKKTFSQENKNKTILFNHEIIVLFRRILNLDIDDKEFNIDVKLEIIDPKNKIIGEIYTPLNFEKGKRIMRFKFKMDSITITIPGDYVYRISIKQLNDKNFKISYEIPLEIKNV